MKTKNSNSKKVLSALFITVIGFALLNIAFLFVAIVTNGLIALYKLIVSNNYPEINTNILVGHVSLIISIIFIGIISFFVLKSKKIKILYKATCLIVPLATIFVLIGMFLSNFQLILYIISVLIFFSILYYFYKTKQPWQYYYTLILTGIIMLIIAIFKIDI